MKHTPVKLWRGQKAFAKQLGKTGTILYSTMIRIPSQRFSEVAPYPVVIVEMDEGEKRTGQLVDFSEDQVKAGQKVITTFRKLPHDDPKGIIPYGIKFKPV